MPTEEQLPFAPGISPQPPIPGADVTPERDKLDSSLVEAGGANSLCIVGNGIWPQHAFDWRTMKCGRCGCEMSAPCRTKEPPR